MSSRGQAIEELDLVPWSSRAYTRAARPAPRRAGIATMLIELAWTRVLA